MKLVRLLTAPNQLVAEMWRDLLVEEGIPVSLQPDDSPTYLGVSPKPCRLMVPQEWLKEAQALLTRHGSGDAPLPS